jgi:hypothetical protein
MQVARNFGLFGLAVVMVACSDATQPTATEPAPYSEGAKVSVTGTSTISIPGLDGKVVSATTHEWATDAIVTDGLALVARAPVSRAPSGGMPVLYVSDAQVSAQERRNTRQIIPWKDSKGNGGDLAFVTGDAGPVKTMVHVGANRQIDQAYSFEWKKVRGGWLATAFTVSLFKNGKVAVQIRSATKGAAPRGPGFMLAADDPCWDDPNCEPADYTGGGGGGGGGGGTYGGYFGGGCCATELSLYSGAVLALGGAYQFCVDTGTLATTPCILTLAGLGITAAALLWAYRSCWNNSPCAGQPPLASIGASPPDAFWLPKQYFRPSAVPA